MDQGSADEKLYPLHCCKTLHLIRHAQGVHNVASEISHDNLLSNEFFDAHLSNLGWNQVDDLRTHVQVSGLYRRIDLVITSPLLRSMQTAVGVFGGESDQTHRNDVLNVAPHLMVANAGNSGRSAIPSLNSPPFMAVELCRERLGVHPCDKRRTVSECRSLFPAFDFSQVESDEDILWKPDVRENNEELAARGIKFLNWLWTRKEKEIAIVTHSGFLSQAFATFAGDCHPMVKSELCTQFANCELRSVVIVNESLIGSDFSTPNYRGKSPRGLHLPSDVANDQKHSK